MKSAKVMNPIPKILTLILLFIATANFSQAQSPTAVDRLDQVAIDIISGTSNLEAVMGSCHSLGLVCCSNRTAIESSLPDLAALVDEARVLARSIGGSSLISAANQMNAKLNAYCGKLNRLYNAQSGSSRFYSAMDDATSDLDTARSIAEGIRVEIQSIRNGN